MRMESLEPSPEVLDEAFAWAVRLGSGTLSSAEEAAFTRWLDHSTENRRAWERVRMVDAEFAAVSGQGALSHELLNRVAGPRHRARAGAVLGLFLMLALVFFWGGPSWPEGADYVTHSGEQRTLTLTGGTRVVLAGDTALDLDLADGRPRLRLRQGAIWVDSGAAPMDAKPRVETPHGRFTPLGTRFSVRHAGDETRMALVEGRVRIAPAGGEPSITVEAGTRWRLGGQGVEALPDDGITPGGWREGRLEARNARLGDLLTRLADHGAGRVRYSEAVADLRVTGSYRLADPAQALAALEQSLPVRVYGVPGWWVWVGVSEP